MNFRVSLKKHGTWRGNWLGPMLSHVLSLFVPSAASFLGIQAIVPHLVPSSPSPTNFSVSIAVIRLSLSLHHHHDDRLTVLGATKLSFHAPFAALSMSSTYPNLHWFRPR